ncbi:tyrosine-type recombinase/integrase [Streptomonospora salina]|uniref:Integrase n=1 Tax=Streptomonospora salina TaxID=104205 RepID=A0A841E4M3_9ACTN|nr:tyrosine-type recombinase/integrase [Streptomonospora salina]MBB5998807.1 integrase [Streptomonospora salina]
MGYARARVSTKSGTRFTAYYIDIKGEERSAGTFTTRKEADRAWQHAEAKVAEGRVTSTKHGRQRFADYVLETWLPNHIVEATTEQNNTYCVHKHLIPEFGKMRMNEILPGHVQEFVRNCQDKGLAASSIRRSVTVLSAIFSAALLNQIIFTHPCKGIVLPRVGRQPLTIITPEEFDDFYSHIDGDVFKLLVEVAIESGLRWGELSELRPKDLDRSTGILTVSRVVVELSPKFHPTGERFLVKDYPKDGKFRRLKLRRGLVTRIGAFAMASGIRDDDLLFAFPEQDTEAPIPGVPHDTDLGLTAPNATGRRYRHGTTTAYTNGKCRCEYCRAAFANYRAVRRAEGKDQPRRRRTVNTDGHIPADWFRKHIWNPARETADLPKGITPHKLRHAHASWLLAGGADLMVVKERLGHASITTTERYLHTLPDADDSALEALGNIRGRNGRDSARSVS